jgi:serine/threonine protein kinase
MVLEYAEGGDLYSLMQRVGGRLAEEQAIHLVLLPFLKALTYMHSRGILHRYEKATCGNKLCMVLLSPENQCVQFTECDLH